MSKRGRGRGGNSADRPMPPAPQQPEPAVETADEVVDAASSEPQTEPETVLEQGSDGPAMVGATGIPAALLDDMQAEMVASLETASAPAAAAPQTPAPPGIVRVRALKSCIVGAGAHFAGDEFRMKRPDAELRVARGEVEVLS
jgi:hypothetical protein